MSDWTRFDAHQSHDPALVRVRPDPPETPAVPSLASPPTGFGDLRRVLLDARFAIAYATDVNFVGAALPGYGAPGAWLRTPALEGLTRASRAAAQRGFGLIIYDAYRPVRSTEAMWNWAINTGNRWLFDDGWVVRRSRHNTGVAVDLSLTDRAGRPLDMGSPFDAFVEASFTANATGAAARNRQTLRTLMVDAGFSPLDQEWWHFEWPIPGVARCDVAYGRAERPGALAVP